MITEREVLAICRVVADQCGVTEADFLGRRHHVERCEARDIAVWIAKQFGASLPMIGRVLRRHHTTILNGYRQQRAAIAQDDAARRKVERLIRIIGNDPLAAEEALLRRQIARAQFRLRSMDAERRAIEKQRAIDAARDAVRAKARRARRLALSDPRRMSPAQQDAAFCAAMLAAGYGETRP